MNSVNLLAKTYWYYKENTPISDICATSYCNVDCIELKYKVGDDVSTLDVAQLTECLALFTHSVYNFQMASSIPTTLVTAILKRTANHLVSSKYSNCSESAEFNNNARSHLRIINRMLCIMRIQNKCTTNDYLLLPDCINKSIY
uniref:DUF4781 domain-containing protein n=1 Tax=Glossina austeni TaxID=7395 RepID=A0A1A9UIS6_GLOAU